MDRVKLKAKARKAIGGKILNIFVIYLVITVVMGIASVITFGLAGILLGGASALAMAFIFLGIVNKNRMPQIDDIMYGVRSETYINGLIGYLRYTVFTFLWSLLFVIPGIVKAISYSMMFFIMVDHPKMDAGEAQKKSMAMTRGHKGDLFVLYLSFIPWFLLCWITFGLAVVYVGPYVMATLASYYEGLKGE